MVAGFQNRGRFARGLANAVGGHLVLVGAIPTPGQLIAEQGGAIGTYVGSDHARLEGESHEYLDAIVSRLTASGLSAKATVRQGKPATQIGEAAREHDPAAESWLPTDAPAWNAP
jgi:hypothetical protein